MRKQMLFLTFLMTSGATFAQGIGDVSVEQKSVASNQPFKLIIRSAGETPACGLEVNLGDGTVRQVRAETFPVTVEHTYQNDGNYAISVTGKLIVRGIRSLAACGGNKSLALQVGPLISPEKQREQERLAEEQRQREQERLAEEQRRKNEESRKALLDFQKNEEARLAAEKKHLAEEKQRHEEMRKAQREEQARKIKELNELGIKFAKESTTKWRALQNKDQMTGKVSEYARAEVTGPAGSAAIELRCEKDPSDQHKEDNIKITFVINNLLVPTTFRTGDQWATGRINANGAVEDMPYLFEKGSVNRFHASDNLLGLGLVLVKQGVICRKDNFEIMAICKAGKNRGDNRTIEYLHTLMVGLKTFKGEILAQVPPFDPAIRSIVKACAGG